MEIAYYPGCSLHASSELYDVQCKKVLGQLGIELKELEDWNCCGATSASKTDDFLAVALPARNLGIADASGLPEIFIPCSSCYSRMRVSQKRLSCDAELKESINDELEKKVGKGVKISSILEVLAPKVWSGEIAEKATKKLEGLKPACYYGCLLTRFPCDVDVPDNVENPQGMETVCKALGTQPLDWSYKTDCCGATASVVDMDQSLLLMSRILRDAIARGANCLVTTCPMCQFNMDAYQERIAEKYGIKERLPVYFITELIGISMGISPHEMHVDRHFTDAMELLKELKLI
ncbi:MAG TPA: CoB--CoM heterodisulfide reductase iron-sulfur subunit B family protein [Thermodesulfovibrionales bacterium]|jgi:heterodisulfide reductase subunit B|nr:CoB--CoM heterodisulfide reductase iron-sulfur subunit B family protein [Thermodesulfovibrionales bacterium]